MPKLKQLIVIAGPAASGKTFLLNRIKKGLCPRLCNQMGIVNSADWHFTNDRDAPNALQVGFDKLIIHYDLYNQYNGEKVRQLLQAADEITALTLCAPPHILAERNKHRILKNLRGWWQNRHNRKFHTVKVLSLSERQIRNKRQPKVFAAYNDWFDLLQEFPAELYWIDSTAIDNPVAEVLNDRIAVLQPLQPHPVSEPWKKKAPFFSNPWKTDPEFFQPLEKRRKLERSSFQGLETKNDPAERYAVRDAQTSERAQTT